MASAKGARFSCLAGDGHVRYLSCAVLLLLVAAAPKAPKAAVEEAQFVGSWLGTNQFGASGGVTFVADGTFTSTRTAPGRAVTSQGRWFLRDGALVWLHNEIPGMQDVNPILQFSADNFTVREMDGTVTSFTRLGRAARAPRVDRGGTPTPRKACAGEIGILCNEAGDDDKAVKDCLHANASKLLPACARALGLR